LTEYLTRLYKSGIDDAVPTETLLSLLNVDAEAQLQREIRDIIDELEIMIHIIKQQEDVITRFAKISLEILNPDEKSGTSMNAKPLVRIMHSDGSWSDIEVKPKTAVDEPTQAIRGNKPHTGHSPDRLKREAFDKRAADLLSEIAGRIKELEGLKKSSETTAQNASITA
jgi:hypothetical protein